MCCNKTNIYKYIYFFIIILSKISKQVKFAIYTNKKKKKKLVVKYAVHIIRKLVKINKCHFPVVVYVWKREQNIIIHCKNVELSCVLKMGELTTTTHSLSFYVF